MEMLILLIMLSIILCANVGCDKSNQISSVDRSKSIIRKHNTNIKEKNEKCIKKKEVKKT